MCNQWSCDEESREGTQLRPGVRGGYDRPVAQH